MALVNTAPVTTIVSQCYQMGGGETTWRDVSRSKYWLRLPYKCLASLGYLWFFSDQAQLPTPWQTPCTRVKLPPQAILLTHSQGKDNTHGSFLHVGGSTMQSTESRPTVKPKARHIYQSLTVYNIEWSMHIYSTCSEGNHRQKINVN